MFNQDPKGEVQRVDLQDEGGGRGREEVRVGQGEGQGGSREEAVGWKGGEGGEREERKEKGEGGQREVAEAEEKTGSEEGERGQDEIGAGGRRGAGGRGGVGTEALDSIGVNFEQQVQACDFDLAPEGERFRPPGSCWSEEAVVSLLQVDNGSSESDEALQREESQRRSRRRFRKINPRGEREVITTDGQEDGGLTTVGALPVR